MSPDSETVQATLDLLPFMEQRRSDLKILPNGLVDATNYFNESSTAATEAMFEGLYGTVYNSIIGRASVRRTTGTVLWGKGTILASLDAFLTRAAIDLAATQYVLDIPCGGGTVLPYLAQQGATGIVIEADLAHAMLVRANDRSRALKGKLRTVQMRCDAMDLPFIDSSIDGAISINGLHCMPDHAQFLHEIGRVLNPASSFWITTLVLTNSKRSRWASAAIQKSGVIPTPPPTIAQLELMLSNANLEMIDEPIGQGIIGLLCRKRA